MRCSYWTLRTCLNAVIDAFLLQQQGTDHLQITEGLKEQDRCCDAIRLVIERRNRKEDEQTADTVI